MATFRQTPQTYALTIVTDGRRRILQIDRNAKLVINTLFRNRDAKRFLLHAFVIMPDHLHALITPAEDQATSRCVQLIKGGSSHAMGKPAMGKIWQDGYHEYRVRGNPDFTHQIPLHRTQSDPQKSTLLPSRTHDRAIPRPPRSHAFPPQELGRGFRRDTSLQAGQGFSLGIHGSQ